MITVWATRRFSFPVLLVLVGLLFAGCSAPSFRQPTGYVFSNEVSLTYLTWNQSDDGHLSGQWRQVRFDPALLSATAQPDVATLGYTGTMQNQHVMLTLSPGGTLLVGQLSHNVLTLSATDNDGQVVTESWQSVTAQDEHALVAAFTASMRVRGALLILGRDMQFTPPFSDFSAADMNWQLYHASVYVAMLQARLASMQQDHSQVSRCQKAVDFAQVSPAPSSLFDLYGQANDLFLDDVKAAQDAWRMAQQVPIPTGVPLPWLVSQQEFATTFVPAQQAVLMFQHEHQEELDQMASLEKQSEQINAQVVALKGSCEHRRTV